MTNPFGFLEKFAIPNDAQMWDNLKSLGLAGLGIGAAGRGALGLYRSAKGTPDPWQHAYPQALVTRIPIPVEDPQEEKMAGDASGIPDGLKGLGFGAGAIGTLGLGAYGGWKGMDYLLNQNAQAQSDSELNKAKQEYEDALRDSYVAPRKTTAGLSAGIDTIKSAGTQLGEALDACYDKLEKQAGIGELIDTVKDYGSQIAHYGPAVYGGYAAATAIPAAMWAYGAVDRSGRRAALEKAIQIRNRQQYMAGPPQIYAIPQPVKAPTRINPEAEAEADASDKEITQQARTPSMAF